MKNDPVQTALAQLDDATPAQLEKALGSKWNVVVAKAARIAGDRQMTALVAPLIKAFERMLVGGASLDKGCAALSAIARALVSLDHDDGEVFRRGMKHVQLEATWGPREDTASELRGLCAMGLANTRDVRRLRDLAELLADPEWQARAGAARAIAAAGGEGAIVLLRYKALVGDKHPDVLSECLAGLVELEGAEALPLLKNLAQRREPEVSETAILALGASRRPDAAAILRDLFEHSADAERTRCILLALASSRLEEAIEFVLEQIRSGSTGRSRMAVEAMHIHRHEERLADAVAAAVSARG